MSINESFLFKGHFISTKKGHSFIQVFEFVAFIKLSKQTSIKETGYFMAKNRIPSLIRQLNNGFFVIQTRSTTMTQQQYSNNSYTNSPFKQSDGEKFTNIVNVLYYYINKRSEENKDKKYNIKFI